MDAMPELAGKWNLRSTWKSKGMRRPMGSAGRLIALVALGGLAMATYAQRPRPSVSVPGPRVAPRLTPAAAAPAFSVPRTSELPVIVAPSGIDEAMIVTARPGIDEGIFVNVPPLGRSSRPDLLPLKRPEGGNQEVLPLQPSIP